MFLAFRTRNFRSLKARARLKRVHDLLSHPLRHKKILRTLSHRNLRPLLVRQPYASIKYLHPHYLALNFNTFDRADAFCHHYAFICDMLPSTAIQSLIETELPMWSQQDADAMHQVSMSLSHPTDNEGELSLNYTFNSAQIYVLSFTIVNGSTLKLGPGVFAFVTRLQGDQNNFDAMRQATRALKDISPAFVLSAVLEGLAIALRIDGLVGISAANQACRERSIRDNTATYDGFFTVLGAAPEPANDDRPTYYKAGFPLPEKSILEVKRGHRSRTKSKRRLRRAISQQALTTMENVIARR